ncbi:MAG: hypothetical protein J6Z14_05680 [Prevotella sp.]|nr:hypothetical protein [Prevotella sp.]
MRKIFHLMAMAIVAVAFTACSDDDDNYLADVTLPAGATGNAMVVDAWSNNFTLDIKSDGEWRVESSDFITVKPSEGKGNATVKVFVEDNEEEQRQKGNVTIVFPGHEGQNKTLAVEQKWQGEYDENADVIGKTNKVYAVGYGYDTTKGLYANYTCLKAQIFKTGELIDAGEEGIGPLDMNAVLSTVTGSSISDLSNKLTVKANASGGVGKFKAEANASFDMNYTDNSTHEYAINYLEATLTTASFDLGIEDLATEDWMTATAYKNINGLNPRYPSTKDGFAALIRTYGTHVVMSARLGGRVRQSLDVDISKITTSYDLHVFAKASYEGVLAKAGGSVNDDFHKSFEENSNSMKVQVQALGGDTKLAKALVAKDGFTEANYSAWFNSVDGDNMALMGFVDNESLIPLYELVDKSQYPQRYQALYDYMNGKEMAETFEDNSTYDTGTVTAFRVPSFGSNYNSTLVKDIMLGGQLVAQVCEEYIPAINRNKRVVVVYPVIGTTVRYNMGFFIGDDTHKPARVAWNGTETNIVEYPELDFGKVETLYLRGASITAAPDTSLVVKQGSVEDEYLNGLYYYIGTSGTGSNITYPYPIVKIFDKIWTRINYNQSVWGNAGRYCTVPSFPRNSLPIWNEYYSTATVTSNEFPKGWRVAKLDDYNRMNNKLVANGFNEPGLALRNNGVTGFELLFVGYYNTDTNAFVDSDTFMWLVTSDKKGVGYNANGATQTNDFTKNRHCIRLVKE